MIYLYQGLSVKGFIRQVRDSEVEIECLWVADSKIFSKLREDSNSIRELRGQKIWKGSLTCDKEWEGKKVQAICESFPGLIVLTTKGQVLQLI